MTASLSPDLRSTSSLTTTNLATETQCVLFDLDGTLLDTAADFSLVLDVMIAERGRPAVSRAAVDQNVSNGARALVEMAFGVSNQHDEFPELLQTLLSLYGERVAQTQAALYPGMDELLSSLESRNIPWGVVTNKPEKFCIPLLRGLGLLERCSALICPDHVTHTKPHPEPLLLACRQIGCQAQASIYVGDHPRDIFAGNDAGMYTIAAAYGYLPADPPIESWGANLIVEDVQTITKLLNATAMS